jgi:hypothetical protein
MGGRAPKQKGTRTERRIVSLCQTGGLAAERIPLSGSVGGRFSGDISVPLLGVDRTVEVKCRASGFAQLYGWLADNFALVVKRDRDAPLVVMRLSDALEIAQAAERAKEIESRGGDR